MPRHRAVYPVVPATYADIGEFDLAIQTHCVDFMIDAGSNGLCIPANFSEQFALADNEGERRMQTILKRVAGRLLVIVTTMHFSTGVGAEHSQHA